MTLRETRNQLHHVLQAAAGVGRALLPPRPDDSHHSFGWSDAHEALLQDAVDSRFRSGLRPRDMTLLLVGDDDSVEASLAMTGRKLEDGFRFYEERFGRAISRPAESFSTMPLQTDTVLRPDGSELELLADRYSQAARVLSHLASMRAGASPVRLWPHHFDIATLISTINRAGSALTLGVGFLGGDPAIDEPYWYVYATPEPAELPPLSIGRWYSGAWRGAILTGEHDDAAIEGFLDEAIGAFTR